MNCCLLHLCSFLRNRFYEETGLYKLILYTIRPVTHSESSTVSKGSHQWVLGDTSLETPIGTTLKILPRLRRQKLNVIKSSLFQGPVLFTERLSSITLTITTTRDEQSVVRKFQALGEVLKWQEGKLQLQGNRQDTGKVSGMLGKRRVRSIYKITNMIK